MRKKQRSPERVQRAVRRPQKENPGTPVTGGVRSHGFDADEELLIAGASGLAPGSAPFWPIAMLAILPRTFRWISWSIRHRRGRGRDAGT